MNDVLALLESLAEAAQPQVMPDSASIRRNAERRRRRTQGTWALAAAAAVAAVAVGAVVFHPRPEQEPAGPTTKLTLPDRFTPPAGSPTWTATLEARGEAGGGYEVRGVAYHDGTWLALGGTWPEGRRSLGWISHDGQHWAAIDVPHGLGGYFSGLVVTDAGFVAVGVKGGYPYVRSSVDGQTWGRPVEILSHLNQYKLYETSQGLFLVGLDEGYGSMLWRSRDEGRHWAPVADYALFAHGVTELDGRERDLSKFVSWVSEKDGTLVAGGLATPPVPNGTPIAELVYTSTDGEHWTEHTRRLHDTHESTRWARWTGPDLSTRDAAHYAVVRPDGRVEVWRPETS